MATFNKFESQTNEILDEGIGDVLNKAQKALSSMTPDAGVFDGPGFASNKYDPKKNYYPNIRSGFGGVFNTKLATANQKVIDAIDSTDSKNFGYKKRGEDFKNPDKPVTGYLAQFVTEKFSKGFISGTIQSFDESIGRVNLLLQKIQAVPSIEHDTLVKSLASFEQTRSKSQYNQLYNDLDAYIDALQNSTNTSITTLSFLQRSHLNNNLEQFGKELQLWRLVMRFTSGGVKAQEDTESPIGNYLDRNGKIYRNLWEDFLDNLKNAVVGTTQSRGWSGSANTYNILMGGQKSKYIGRAKLDYNADVQTIPPNMLKAFHDGTMTALFLKPQILLYATPEQWEAMTQGGRLYKAVTGVGAQAYGAGKSAPRVSL